MTWDGWGPKAPTTSAPAMNATAATASRTMALEGWLVIRTGSMSFTRRRRQTAVRCDMGVELDPSNDHRIGAGVGT